MRENNHRLISLERLLAGTALGAGVLFTVLDWGVATAQTAPPSDIPQVSEVIVTANKRVQKAIDIPFNISAYGARQLNTTRVTTLAELSQQVPNFVIQDFGARWTGSAVPIIRGLNASQPVADGPVQGQSPVAFYVGNSPTPIDLGVDDVARVEVLRGPQGTLYGSGSLGGTVRVIPVDPKLGIFEGQVGASVGAVAHSSDPDYTAFFRINVPLGQTLAFRGNFKYRYDAGFIDQFGIIQREGNNYRNGVPVLANPADFVNSAAVYFNKKDVNWDDSYTGRVSLLWTPTEKFRINLSENLSVVSGNGAPIDNIRYQGGPDPFNPDITFPAAGPYRVVLSELEPWRRRSSLSSIDATYDLGFATLSTTSSFFETKNDTVQDGAGVLNFFGPLAAVYLGIPTNPRVIVSIYNYDDEHTFTQEVRLTSKTGGVFDYTVGGYFDDETRRLNQTIYCPGCSAQTFASNGGSMLPVILGGGFVPTLPDGTSYFNFTTQKFKEEAIFGELTYHLTKKWQITGGGRYFWEQLSQGVNSNAVLFLSESSAANRSSVHDGIFKFNTSYDYLPSHRVYATVSEGFRRGGGNTFPLSGFVAEPESLLTYGPDTVLNYEVGLKGAFANGTSYTFDGFYEAWDKPQISTNTPTNGWPVVVNGSKAVSKGFEVEVSGPLLVHGLTYIFGAAYADARLTKPFCLPAGDGAGGFTDCATALAGTINASTGSRLPGAPKFSASLTLNYVQTLAPSWTINYSLNADYRSSVVNGLSTQPGIIYHVPGYALLNGSITVDHKNWEIMGYIHNIANSRVVLGGGLPTQPFGQELLGDLAYFNYVNRPLEVGAQLAYKW
jgi:outer membrane receptor protein involved in Fe transport